MSVERAQGRPTSTRIDWLARSAVLTLFGALDVIEGRARE